MTQENKGFEAFRKAADEIKTAPKDSSWDRLETMLDNKTLAEENKSYKKLIKWSSGIAAVILLIGSIVFFYNANDVTDPKIQFAYTTESFQNLEQENSSLYDIEKLAQLNDAELWANIVEGGPKLQVKKVLEN